MNSAAESNASNPSNVSESVVFDSARSGDSVADKGNALANLLGADLAFVQNRQGAYVAFFWKQAAAYGVCDTSPAVVSRWFAPHDRPAYEQVLHAVFRNAMPQRGRVTFASPRGAVTFEVTLTPIVRNELDQILVLGRLVPTAQPVGVTIDIAREISSAMSGAVHLGENPCLLSRVSFPRFLTHIARKIRQTLDFNTVWTQAAESLNDAFDLHACHVFTLSSQPPTLHCVAAHGTIDPELNVEHLAIASHPGFADAVSQLTPTITLLVHQGRSRLIIATAYQGVANGLIVLDRALHDSRPQAIEAPNSPDAPANTLLNTSFESVWYPIELEIIEEIANQVGTAAAHATLYRELEVARIQAEELSRLKSEFLANTSHELRTPLNGMMGFLKLIMDGMAEDAEEQTEFIEEAYRSAVHLLNIINDILDVAKIESGKMDLDFEPVNLTELLNRLRDFTQSQVQAKQLSFEIKLPRTDDKILLYGNYQRLLQVLLNLVGNAIKFTHEGGITISCEILRRRVNVGDRTLPGFVKIQVADTGIGISLDKQDRLFQSFSQVDGSRTRTYGGTGLGLVISQKLIETMGGEVNFFSLGEGLGSTVTFTAPLYQEPVFISPSASVGDLLQEDACVGVADLSLLATAEAESDLMIAPSDLSEEVNLESNLDRETLALAAELNVMETEDFDTAIEDLSLDEFSP